MSLTITKFIHNNFPTTSQFEQAVNLIYKFFYKQITSVDEYYYFWNKTDPQLLREIYEIIHSFNKRDFNDVNIFCLHIIFLLEGIINLNPKNKSISACIKYTLFRGLNKEEKTKLLYCLLFSKEMDFNQKVFLKHTFCIENKTRCSLSCDLKTEYIDKAFSQLVDKIYQIRSSCVHLGLIPNFVLKSSRITKKSYVRIYDKFALRAKHKFVYFSSSLDSEFFEFIIKKSIWKHLNKNI